MIDVPVDHLLYWCILASIAIPAVVIVLCIAFGEDEFTRSRREHMEYWRRKGAFQALTEHTQHIEAGASAPAPLRDRRRKTAG